MLVGKSGRLILTSTREKCRGCGRALSGEVCKCGAYQGRYKVGEVTMPFWDNWPPAEVVGCSRCNLLLQASSLEVRRPLFGPETKVCPKCGKDDKLEFARPLTTEETA